MPVDMFMKIGDLQGESQDPNHFGWSDIESWSWGLNNPGSASAPSTRRSRAAFEDMTIVKKTDSATAGIFMACATGAHFSDAKLTVRKAGEKPLEYLTVTMKNVLVTSVGTGGSEADDLPTDTFTLNFGEVHYEYTAQDETAKTEFKWDIAKNEPG